MSVERAFAFPSTNVTEKKKNEDTGMKCERQCDDDARMNRTGLKQSQHKKKK